jgi:hypothetical protein
MELINIKKMKRIKRIISIGFLLGIVLCNLSCNKFLDLVPDNTVTLEDYFTRRDMAWNTLSKVYSYLPDDANIINTSWTLGDEWVGDVSKSEDISMAIRIMQGLQNSTTPKLSIWDGGGAGYASKPLYQGIRSANIFLDYIDIVEDMTDEEITDWKSQVKFLKAYYHFLLLRQYGPIVIMDKSIPLDAVSDDLFLRRAKVEDCFNFIINLMNEAIPGLKERATLTNLGQVDKVSALAIKARVMLFRASPFFNGNKQYYEDFLDHNGEPFFPLDEKIEKWQDALDAINEAITICEINGFGMYEYDKNSYAYDRADYAANSSAMKTLYDLRMLIVDPWNKEVIWGRTYDITNDILSSASNIVLPIGYGDGSTNNLSFSRQLFGASYRMLERYYTKNGLPLNEDITFDPYTKLEIITTPGVEDTVEYEPLRGFMQPGAKVVKLYMDREPRFYANLGISGGYWRAHAVRINTLMFYGSDGGANPNFQNNFLCTGVGVQKFVHPEAKSDGYQMQIRYPLPIIRMADLYLMKAEALNELDAPKGEVYAEINKIRHRAGIPDVETVWSDASLVNPRSLNKHLNKTDMRDIILQERSIELAFEGSRFWDMHRHKRALTEFSSSIMGWDHSGFDAEYFFVIGPKQVRRFLFRDYLWPLSLNEMNINSNLIQNPGW